MNNFIKPKVPPAMYLILLAGLLSMQLSCSKDDSTLPVRVNLNVSLTPALKSDNISFQSGEIVLKEIQFEGKREVGENYSFYTAPGKLIGPVSFNISSGSQPVLAYFDLPQGKYTVMDWKFQLADGLDSYEADDVNGSPGLILNGTYRKVNGEELQVRVEIDPFEVFNCKAVNSSGNKTIDIISERGYNAGLVFDPYFAFRPVTSNTIEKAGYSDGVILISPNSNADIYEVILFRLQLSARLVVSG